MKNFRDLEEGEGGGEDPVDGGPDDIMVRVRVRSFYVTTTTIKRFPINAVSKWACCSIRFHPCSQVTILGYLLYIVRV